MPHGANAYTFDDTVTLDASSVPNNSAQVESFTVNGLKAGLPVLGTKKVRDNGVSVVEYECPSDDTLEMTFLNLSGAAVNPGSQDYHLIQP